MATNDLKVQQDTVRDLNTANTNLEHSVNSEAESAKDVREAEDNYNLACAEVHRLKSNKKAVPKTSPAQKKV